MSRRRSSTPRASTLKELLRSKPQRGRPRHAVSRQNVYVALTKRQKGTIKELSTYLPEGMARADVPDLAITALAARLEALRRAVADRNREMPEGVTDLDSLYLLWDLPLPAEDPDEPKWTSIRLSPQQVIELGRVNGTLQALFGANRSETFSLSLALLNQWLEDYPLPHISMTLDELRKEIVSIYL